MLRVSEQIERTDTGLERTANEDSFFARAPVFAVADGMGGAQAGEVASQIAADSFEDAEPGETPPEAFLEGITREANRQINELARRDKDRSGMGTTLTSAIVHGDEVSIAHVGDSRAYLYRDGELRQVTTDHSLVEELRRQGRLTREEAAIHPQRSIITRALGPEPEVAVDTLTVQARPDDLFLLCSDGLTAMVSDERIGQILSRSDNLKQAARALINEANAKGGRDNITVVGFRLEAVPAASQSTGATEEVTLIGQAAAEAGLDPKELRAASAQAKRDVAKRQLRRGAGVASWRRPLAAAAVILAVIALAFVGNRQVYFLGVDEGGRAAIYRGLPYDLPLGIELYDEIHSSPVQAEEVPADRRRSLTDHDLRSRGDAIDLLADLEREVTGREPGGNP